jgi:hypothetical protein
VLSVYGPALRRPARPKAAGVATLAALRAAGPAGTYTEFRAV